MNDEKYEKWFDILSIIKDKFDVEEENKRELSEEEGRGVVEWIVFRGPLGKIKLERLTKPVILDKKTTYSRRVGSETKVEYIYSDTEVSQKLKAYKWDEASQEWIEIEAEKSGFSI